MIRLIVYFIIMDLPGETQMFAIENKIRAIISEIVSPLALAAEKHEKRLEKLKWRDREKSKILNEVEEKLDKARIMMVPLDLFNKKTLEMNLENKLLESENRKEMDYLKSSLNTIAHKIDYFKMMIHKQEDLQKSDQETFKFIENSTRQLKESMTLAMSNLSNLVVKVNYGLTNLLEGMNYKIDKITHKITDFSEKALSNLKFFLKESSKHNENTDVKLTTLLKDRVEKKQLIEMKKKFDEEISSTKEKFASEYRNLSTFLDRGLKFEISNKLYDTFLPLLDMKQLQKIVPDLNKCMQKADWIVEESQNSMSKYFQLPAYTLSQIAYRRKRFEEYLAKCKEKIRDFEMNKLRIMETNILQKILPIKPPTPKHLSSTLGTVRKTIANPPRIFEIETLKNERNNIEKTENIEKNIKNMTQNIGLVSEKTENIEKSMKNTAQNIGPASEKKVVSMRERLKNAETKKIENNLPRKGEIQIAEKNNYAKVNSSNENLTQKVVNSKSEFLSKTLELSHLDSPKLTVFPLKPNETKKILLPAPKKNNAKPEATAVNISDGTSIEVDMPKSLQIEPNSPIPVKISQKSEQSFSTFRPESKHSEESSRKSDSGIIKTPENTSLSETSGKITPEPISIRISEKSEPANESYHSSESNISLENPSILSDSPEENNFQVSPRFHNPSLDSEFLEIPSKNSLPSRKANKNLENSISQHEKSPSFNSAPQETPIFSPKSFVQTPPDLLETLAKAQKSAIDEISTIFAQKTSEFSQEISDLIASEIEKLADSADEIVKIVNESTAELRDELSREQQELKMHLQLIHEENKQILKQRLQEIAKNDLEFKNLKSKIEEINVDMMLSKSEILNINAVLEMLTEAEKIVYSLIRQDELDREGVHLIGFSENKQRSMTRPKISIGLKQDCLSCSGQNPAIYSAFKMACLNYGPSEVEFQNRLYPRKKLLYILGEHLNSPTDHSNIASYDTISKVSIHHNDSFLKEKSKTPKLSSRFLLSTSIQKIHSDSPGLIRK